MSRSWKIRITVGLCLVLIVGLGMWNQFREPSYAGKSLSEWIDLLDSNGSVDLENPNDPTLVQARTAVRHIGTNALPFLLRWIHASDSRFKLKLEEWAGMQNVVTIRFHHAVEKQTRGVAGFFLLGEVAAPANPKLKTILTTQNDGTDYAFAALGFIGKDSLPFLTNCLISEPHFRSGALDALARMGTNAEPALDLLISLLQTNDLQFKQSLIWSLHHVGRKKPEIVVPALIQQMQNTNGMVSIRAMDVLGQFGTNATAAIPELTKLLNNPRWCGRAALNLASVSGTNAAIKVVLEKIKTTPDNEIKLGLIGILSLWKVHSANLVPELLVLAEDQDVRVRRAALDAAIALNAQIEDIIPILLKHEAKEPSRLSMTVFSALAKSGKRATALVPLLVKHIRILHENNGEFPGDVVPNPYMPVPFHLEICQEFIALR